MRKLWFGARRSLIRFFLSFFLSLFFLFSHTGQIEGNEFTIEKWVWDGFFVSGGGGEAGGLGFCGGFISVGNFGMWGRDGKARLWY